METPGILPSLLENYYYSWKLLEICKNSGKVAIIYTCNFYGISIFFFPYNFVTAYSPSFSIFCSMCSVQAFSFPDRHSCEYLASPIYIYKTEWTILDKAKPCSPATRKCDLCLTEKYHILLEKSRLLNKRSEIFGTCPTERNTFYKIRIAATKKIRPDEYLSTKQICCRENPKMGN